MKQKLCSRKFWVCVAALLASVATSIGGLSKDNETIVLIGMICSITSTAIYTFCEAWVDAVALDTTKEDVYETDSGQEL